MNRLAHLLSKRERQVMEGIAEGMKPKEIAEIMRISHKTVWEFSSRVRKKLKARNTIHAVVLWTRGEAQQPQQVRDMAGSIVRMATKIALDMVKERGA